jgi:cardiolipin synthase A/B
MCGQARRRNVVVQRKHIMGATSAISRWSTTRLVGGLVGGLVGVSAALLLLVFTAACSSLPQRRPAPAAPELTARQVAQRMTLHDAQGPMSEAREQRTLLAWAADDANPLFMHHLGVLAGTGDVNLYRGNDARLLIDGPATFAAKKAALARAQHRILLESYIFEDSGIAAEIGELLARQAAAGVNVSLMVDGIGSFGTDEQFFAGLRAAGVHTCVFNPVNPLQRPGVFDVNHRDHRKLLVVDNDIAITGGINISDVYSSGSSGSSGRSKARAANVANAANSERGWRDTNIELRGPVVQAMADEFKQIWVTQACDGAVGDAPAPPTAGTRVVKVLTSEPVEGYSRIYTTLLAAIDAAQRSVKITMAYFAPGTDLVDALCDAARRGVEVTLILPSRSDSQLVLQAGRSYYQRLLSSGVRVFELQDALLHAKTAVIDDVWSTVGSSNLDWRSLVDNNELNVVVLGPGFAGEMQAQFDRDLEVSRAIEAEAWRRRDVLQRLQETVGWLAERWL